jgi:uncharacterized protein HemX
MNKRADAQPVQRQDTIIKDPKAKAKSKISVYLYISALFLVVILFILLSYFIQQRSNTEISALHEKNTAAEQNIENLQDTNLQLKNENEEYQNKIGELEGKISILENEVTAMKAIQENIMNSQKAGHTQNAGTAG